MNVEAAREVLALKQACTVTVTQKVVDLAKYGAALRQRRKDAGISCRAMAKMLGVSVSFLSDCERGFRRLKLTAQVEFIEICRNNQ